MRSARWLFIVCGIEGTLVCMLVETRSRGPILATLIAYIALIVSRLRTGVVIRPAKSLYADFFMLSAILALSALPNNLRLHTFNDGSATNRLAVWKAGVKMIGLRPWRGVGAWEGAHLYNQWYQPLTSSYAYKTLLSAYLNIAVNYGIVVVVVLGGFMVGLMLTSFYAYRICEQEPRFPFARDIGLAGSGTILVYLLCSFGADATGKVEHGLILLAAALAVLFNCFNAKLWRIAFIFFGVAVLMVFTGCMFALAYGIALSSGDYIHIDLDRGGVIRLSSNDSINVDNKRRATILVDVDVLGPLFGQEVRRSMEALVPFRSLSICDPRFPVDPSVLNKQPTLIVFGRAVDLIDQVDEHRVRRIIIVHPTSPAVPLTRFERSEVLLHAGSLTPAEQTWRQRAKIEEFELLETSAMSYKLIGLETDFFPL